MIGRVVGIFGPRVEIAENDKLINAVMRGKVKYASSGISLIAVGDYVEYIIKPKGPASIERILKRNSCISRPAIEKEGLIQVIVSNIDRLVAMTSITNPLFKPGLVDRYLVVAFKEKIHPVVVINKIDLADPSSLKSYIEAWQRFECDVICTSAVTGEGIDKLSHILEKGTSVITGHSGVGKSSILNCINSDLKIKTAKISLHSSRGVHTTSRVTLFQLFPDGWVADTPGLKDLGLVGVERRTLHRYFPEFANFEAYCQFGNCVHVNEPGCAVKKAVEESHPEIAAFRYKSYLNIYESLK
jgi:ribosome biogenesis GTPase / thiamine phosphate phosphatase